MFVIAELELGCELLLSHGQQQIVQTVEKTVCCCQTVNHEQQKEKTIC